jgi:hypothetical protein
MSDNNLPKPSLQKSGSSNSSDQEKSFAKKIQQSEIYNAMDDKNQKALNVFAEKGADAAIAHMFTDQSTGRQLSYSEMRSRYG